MARLADSNPSKRCPTCNARPTDECLRPYCIEEAKRPQFGAGRGSDTKGAGARNTRPTSLADANPSYMSGFALFSGGHDSLCSTHLAMTTGLAEVVVHINTGIGIEETRQFVRDTCAAHGWPLIEMHPDAKTYRDLVAEKGMPGGPKAHSTTYYWLKQRQVRRLVREHKTKRDDRVGLVTGIRIAESERRMASVMAKPEHRIGSQVWVNPILDWTAADCNRYIEANGLQRNQVVDLLHRSGECLCGALAHHTEIREIEQWYPDAANVIHEYERLAASHGHLEDVWAGRLTVNRQQGRLPLCSSCELRTPQGGG